MPGQFRQGDQGVDPRGPRFAAWITTVVLAVVLVTQWWWLLAAQAVVFGIGALAGPRSSPYSLVFRVFVAPRLAASTEREPVAPVRFAQAVGFVFAAVGLVGFTAGPVWLGFAATALAFVAALLNAAFGFCLGCQLYPLVRRLAPASELPQ